MGHFLLERSKVMFRKLMAFLMALGLTFSMAGIVGCEEGPAEEAGEEVDDAAD